MPPYNFKTQLRTQRSSGLPQIGERHNPDKDDRFKEKHPVHTTPYRLPTGRPESTAVLGQSLMRKVWGRHGYDYYTNSRPGAVLLPVSQVPSPRPLSLHNSSSVVGTYPRFQHAMITPVQPPKPKLYAGSYSDPAFSKSAYSQPVKCTSPTSLCLPEIDKSSTIQVLPYCNTPVYRQLESSYSETRRSAFMPSRASGRTFINNPKVKKRVQGPYSREFTVTCMAPTNWKRMKWGRLPSASL